MARRAGILFPLFSLHSSSSVGVGEFMDLVGLAQWCRQAGLSIIQLLPLNDVGSDFRPYDSTSLFALEPMHISLSHLEGVSKGRYEPQIQALRNKFPLRGQKFLDTGIKSSKLKLLRQIFDDHRGSLPGFERFKKDEQDWLDPFAQFKVLKRRFNGHAWEQWPADYRQGEASALQSLAGSDADALEFERWLQWQASVQMEEVHRQVQALGVRLIGDLPFLVSRDSADVWSQQSHFHLNKASGAPPDLYFAEGQVWGMPPHHWEAQEKDGFSYLRRKVQTAARFYDAFRIDHFVGLFRVWTMALDQSKKALKKTGAFEPADESEWEQHGRKILDAMIEAAPILPCAEDLGVVPDCSEKILREYAIPGMDIQRWTRHWHGDKSWKKPSEYREISITTISTHDMSPLELWWKDEMTDPADRSSFLQWLGLPANGKLTAQFIESCLNAAMGSASIFSIQLFQDWFSLERPGNITSTDRLNFPGTTLAENWRLLSPYSLKEMTELSCLPRIKSLVSENKRVQ